MRAFATTGLTLLVIFVMVAASGCSETRSDTIRTPPPRTSMSSKPPAAPSETPQPPRTPPRETPPTAPPPMSAPVGSTRVRQYEPAGQTAGSPLLIERCAPKEVRVGQPFEYLLKVTNVSGKVLADVTLAESIPENVTVQSTTPKSSKQTEGHLTWLYRTLGPGQAASITIQAVASKTGLLNPCVEVSYKPTAVCIGISVVQPELALVKTAPESALTCEVIPVTLTVRNCGSGSADNVVVRDPLPKGMTSMDGKECLILQAGTLRPGESKQFTERLRVGGEGTFTNTASATAAGGIDVASNQVTTVVHQPKIQVVKEGPDMRYVGRPVPYTITVTNTGKVPATKTVLTDRVPPGATCVSASAGGTSQGDKIVWDLGTIAPGKAKTVSVTVSANQPATLRSTASATAVCCEAGDSASTLVKGIPAILLEVVDLEDPIEVGGNETYVITVTNQGSAVGTNIVIACTLPPQQTYASSDGPTRVKVAEKDVTFAPLPQLAPKAKATYRVVVKGTKPGDVRFTVQLTSDQMESPAGETESTHIYE